MLLTYKTRVFPTKEQTEVLWELAERCRLLYNFALAERKTIWEHEKHFPKGHRVFLSYTDQQNALPQLKKHYPEYAWVYSKVLQLTLRTLDADFKSFFALWKKGDRQARPPHFKRKSTFLTLKYNQSGFKLAHRTLTLAHRHPSQVELAFFIPYLPAGQIKQVEVSYDHVRKHWYVAFNCKIEVPPTPIMACIKRLMSGLRISSPR